MCECNKGFYKDVNTRVNDTCININECDGSAFDNATAIHNCDKNADCIDTIGFTAQKYGLDVNDLIILI